jgi:hypothetical protein
MAKVQLPIANGFYVSDALPISAQQAVNWYPNVPQSDTVTPDNLFNTPGLEQLATVGDITTTRGSHVMAGIAYFVIGTALVRLNRVVVGGVDTFTTDTLGTVPGVDRVFMADNGTQLVIVAPPDSITTGKSFTFIEPSTFAEITDANFDGPAGSVVFVDGFFVFHKDSSKKFINSALNDARGAPSGTAYDALDFSSAEADPDDIEGQIVYRNQLYEIGTQTIEIFRNIGRAPSPFQRIAGAVVDVGTRSPQTLVLFGGSIAMVGSGVNESPAVWMVAGGNKRKISTTAIDNELSKLTDTELSNLFSWVYAESGAFFMGITLPNTCFVFDLINQRWHERQSVDGTSDTQYRVASMITAYGRVVVGDLQDGRIGAINEDLFTEYGVLVRRFVTSKPFDNLGEPLHVASVEAVVESGVGLTNDATVQSGEDVGGTPIDVVGGSDPQMTLSWSDQGGRPGTFVGNRSRSMGKIGEYKRRPIWRRLGRFPRSRVLKFEVSSPTKATMIKVEADVG